jgi:hypothetical protein
MERGLTAFERAMNGGGVVEEREPTGETALALLQAVYRDQRQPLHLRIRCASEALPYEAPRLSAVGIASLSGNDFAAALDRAIARSNGKAPLMIEARAEERVD